jgi:hypothetical protein
VRRSKEVCFPSRKCGPALSHAYARASGSESVVRTRTSQGQMRRKGHTLQLQHGPVKPRDKKRRGAMRKHASVRIEQEVKNCRKTNKKSTRSTSGIIRAPRDTHLSTPRKREGRKRWLAATFNHTASSIAERADPRFDPIEIDSVILHP